jgi:hypothetical protein
MNVPARPAQFNAAQRACIGRSFSIGGLLADFVRGMVVLHVSGQARLDRGMEQPRTPAGLSAVNYSAGPASLGSGNTPVTSPGGLHFIRENKVFAEHPGRL